MAFSIVKQKQTMLSLKTLKKRANYGLYFCHQIKGKSYLRIACKHGHYCIIF